MKKGWAFSAFVAGIALITGTPAYPASYQAAIDLSKGTADQKRTNTYTGQFDVTIQFRGSHLSTDAEMDIGGSPGIPPEGKRIEKWCNVMLSGVVTGYLVGTLEVQDRSSKTSLAPEAGSSRFGFSGYSNATNELRPQYADYVDGWWRTDETPCDKRTYFERLEKDDYKLTVHPLSKMLTPPVDFLLPDDVYPRGSILQISFELTEFGASAEEVGNLIHLDNPNVALDRSAVLHWKVNPINTGDDLVVSGTSKIKVKQNF